MSAECHKHGCDLVYREGTWPVGVCPKCESEARISELEARVESLTAALKELASAAQPYHDEAAPHEELFNPRDYHNFDLLSAALHAARSVLESKDDG